MIIEFFIPNASVKAVLIIPMLTLAPIEGISKTVIILTYLFVEWFKKTILFQLLLMVIAIGFVMLAVSIGL